MSLSPFALLRARTRRAATTANAAHVPGMTRTKATTKPATPRGRRSLEGIATAAATLMLLGLAPAGAFAASFDGAAAEKAASSSSIQASATGSSLGASTGAGGDGAVLPWGTGGNDAALSAGTGDDGSGLGAFLAERRGSEEKAATGVGAVLAEGRGAESDGKGGESALLQ